MHGYLTFVLQINFLNIDTEATDVPWNKDNGTGDDNLVT